MRGIIPCGIIRASWTRFGMSNSQTNPSVLDQNEGKNIYKNPHSTKAKNVIDKKCGHALAVTPDQGKTKSDFKWSFDSLLWMHTTLCWKWIVKNGSWMNWKKLDRQSSFVLLLGKSIWIYILTWPGLIERWNFGNSEISADTWAALGSQQNRP